MYDLIMKIFDYFFHYKYVLRFLFLEKQGVLSKNTYTLPKISQLHNFFVIKDLVDFENLKSSNYFFFFKYFFGKKAFFINYKTRFSLNVLYHSFYINLIIAKKDLYIFINFLFNDILPFCNKRYLKFNSRKYISFKILDMNIFLEKKTHIGFFFLKEPLYMKFFFSGLEIEKKNLFNLLKFKI
jgi:hypothetical protein